MKFLLVLGKMYCLYFLQDLYKLEKLSSSYSNHDIIKPFNFTVNQFPYDPEGKQPEDRDLMQDMQTKFVPSAESYHTLRQKRSTGQTLETYQVSPIQ